MHVKAMRLFATALVMIYLRHNFPLQFPVPAGLRYSDNVDPLWRQHVKTALSWFHTTEKTIPSLCTRLELGNSYDDFAEATLGI